MSKTPAKTPPSVTHDSTAWIEEWTQDFFENGVWPLFNVKIKPLNVVHRQSKYSSRLFAVKNLSYLKREYIQRWELKKDIHCSLFLKTRVEMEQKKMKFDFIYTSQEEIPLRFLWSCFVILDLEEGENSTMNQNNPVNSQHLFRQKVVKVTNALIENWKRADYSYITHLRAFQSFVTQNLNSTNIVNADEMVFLIYPSPSILKTNYFIEEEGNKETTRDIPELRWDPLFDPFMARSTNVSVILLAQNLISQHFRKERFRNDFSNFGFPLTSITSPTATTTSISISTSTSTSTTTSTTIPTAPLIQDKVYLFVTTSLPIQFKLEEVETKSKTKKSIMKVYFVQELVYPNKLQKFLKQKNFEENPNIKVKWIGLISFLPKLLAVGKEKKKTIGKERTKWQQCVPVGTSNRIDFVSYLQTLGQGLHDSGILIDFVRKSEKEKKKKEKEEKKALGTKVAVSTTTPTSSPSTTPPPSTTSSLSITPPPSTIFVDILPKFQENEIQNLVKEQLSFWHCYLLEAEEIKGVTKKDIHKSRKHAFFTWWIEEICDIMVSNLLTTLQIQSIVKEKQEKEKQKAGLTGIGSVPPPLSKPQATDDWLATLELNNSDPIDYSLQATQLSLQVRVYSISLTCFDVFLIVQRILLSRFKAKLQISFLPEIYQWAVNLSLRKYNPDKLEDEWKKTRVWSISAQPVDWLPKFTKMDNGFAYTNPMTTAIPIPFLIQKLPLLPHLRHLPGKILNWFESSSCAQWNLLFQKVFSVLDCFSEYEILGEPEILGLFPANLTFENFFKKLDEDDWKNEVIKRKVSKNVNIAQNLAEMNTFKNLKIAANFTSNTLGILHKEKKQVWPFFFLMLNPEKIVLINSKETYLSTDIEFYSDFSQLQSNPNLLQKFYELYTKYQKKVLSKTKPTTI